jgi:putative transposase
VARKYRVEQLGGIFHVATRAVYERFSFDNADDRWSFLAELGEVITACGWRCKSYCLMGNHYHLILQTPHANLSIGMQLLNGKYAQRFNGRHRRHGHLFGSRFYSVLIETDRHLHAALRYVARNPVEAGLCRGPADWRWSSYRATIGLEPAPRLLDSEGVLGLFGLARPTARQQFMRLVEGPEEADLPDEATLIRMDGF